MLIKYFENRRKVPGFLVNSMPKAGTHLVMKAVNGFPGIRQYRGIQITNGLADSSCKLDDHHETVQIGVDWPQPVLLQTLRQALQQVGKGQYLKAHTCYSSSLHQALQDLGMKTILILRDPRAVVLSHAKYVASTPAHYLYAHYQKLDEAEQLQTSILGLEPDQQSNSWGLLNIRERYMSLLAWNKHSINYTTTFEKLVGPEGGGSRSAQCQELENIAAHLGIRYNPTCIMKIAKNLFGNTSTFRQGSIDGWQTYFSDEHLVVFRDIAGDLLNQLEYEDDLS